MVTKLCREPSVRSPLARPRFAPSGIGRPRRSLPGHHESVGKRKPGKTRRGNRWLIGSGGGADRGSKSQRLHAEDRRATPYGSNAQRVGNSSESAGCALIGFLLAGWVTGVG